MGGKRKSTKDEYVLKLKNKGRTDIRLLGEYIDSKTKTLFECTKDGCGHQFMASPAQVMYGTGCPACNGTRLKTNDEFMAEFLAKGNPNVEILGKYTGRDKPILARCIIDGHTWTPLAKELLAGVGCPVCSSRIIIPHINSLAIKRPDLLIYFLNPDDARYIAPQSQQIVTLKCPDCGTIRTMRAADLYHQGFSCQVCSDNISYPNKFIRCVIAQLNENINVLSYEWSEVWSNRLRYDVYFEFDNQKYIIEMQGAQHYGFGWYKDVPIDELLERDKNKADLALQHNITPIVIDARISDACFIINNIKNSLLSKIFNLSDINWDQCAINATKNLIKEICSEYQMNDRILLIDIANKYMISRTTVREYLKIGNKLGWCVYSTNDGHKRVGNMMCKKVKVFNKNRELLYTYDSITECANELSLIYGTTFYGGPISNACKNMVLYKNLYFEYA